MHAFSGAFKLLNTTTNNNNYYYYYQLIIINSWDIFFIERDKVQRQFKLFRESKEREIQDVLLAKRELEMQIQRYLSMTSHDEQRLEVVDNLATDWFTSSLESDPSVDSLTQVTSFRGPEFFQSPMEREGPFTNISRGINLAKFVIILFIYLSGFAKTWLKKFQLHFNNLTFKLNGKQLKLTCWGLTMTTLLLATDGKLFLQSNRILPWNTCKQHSKRPEIITF